MEGLVKDEVCTGKHERQVGVEAGGAVRGTEEATLDVVQRRRQTLALPQVHLFFTTTQLSKAFRE